MVAATGLRLASLACMHSTDEKSIVGDSYFSGVVDRTAGSPQTIPETIKKKGRPSGIPSFMVAATGLEPATSGL